MEKYKEWCAWCQSDPKKMSRSCLSAAFKDSDISSGKVFDFPVGDVCVNFKFKDLPAGVMGQIELQIFVDWLKRKSSAYKEELIDEAITNKAW